MPKSSTCAIPGWSKLAEHLRFPRKAIVRVFGHQDVGANHLDRHRFPEPKLGAAVHHPHRTLPKLGLDSVFSLSTRPTMASGRELPASPGSGSVALCESAGMSAYGTLRRENAQQLTSFARSATISTMMSRFVSTLCALCGLVALSQTTTAKAEAPQEIPAADRAKTTVCTDGKSHYVVMAPDERLISALFMAVTNSFIGCPPNRPACSAAVIFGTTLHCCDENPSFRGVDMRIYSEVVVDKEKIHLRGLLRRTQSRAPSRAR